VGVSSKSCGLQGDKAGRRVCPPELRTPQPCAVLKPRRCRLRGRRASGAWGFPGRPDGLVFGPSRQDSATSLPGTGERQEHDHAHSAGLRVGSLVLTGLPTDDELLATHAQVVVDRPVEQLPLLLLGELLNVPLLPSQRVFHEPPFQLMRPRYPINTNFPLAFATAYLEWRR
jgi:hypothetical protein